MRELIIHYTPELLTVMRAKNKKNIALEVASSNASDFEVTELYLRFVSDRMVKELIKKRYRALETSEGLFLLPPYRLEYDSELTLGYEKGLLFHHITCQGVRL
ncbi:MAG: hypothetical protein IIZ39_09025 [Blautia sp.]|nr:hypothetical protein [Blautia sp.]